MRWIPRKSSFYAEQAAYFLVVASGVGITAVVIRELGQSLFSNYPQSVYEEAAVLVPLNKELERKIGPLRCVQTLPGWRSKLS